MKAEAKKITPVFSPLPLLIFLFLVFASSISAETLPIKTYTSADGLVYEGVRRVYQDSRGFVWFCTPIGISRFDGYQLTSYAMEDGLSNPAIVDVVEDARRSLARHERYGRL